MNRGVTLIELMIVVAIIAILAGLSFPSLASGVDTLRLSAASDNIVSFLNAALNRAERRQQPMEITIDKAERALWLRSSEPGFERKLDLPDGVSILNVFPAAPSEEGPRRFFLYPGGTVPRLGVEIVNRRGAHRIVRVDPITGVPLVERGETDRNERE